MAADLIQKRRNWWKVAFFVALVAFEFAREEAVVLANESTTGNLFDVQAINGFVTAEGQWFRSDAGSPLVPNATAIQCVKETRVCIEASTTFLDRTGYASINTYDDAVFTDTSVDYEDDSPLCAVHRVHIDLVQKRVTATTDRKETTVKACEKFEEHIPAELSDKIRWRRDDASWMQGHFIPLFRIIRRQ